MDALEKLPSLATELIIVVLLFKALLFGCKNHRFLHRLKMDSH